ncbi:methyltransferase domain-containing protein [Ekhidna sp.]|uniref:methyltransferase domain-containing protein n=1 Tax=Ekhidna sp. TaxID=2608089 RepID=UPI003CCC12E5
MTRFSIKKIPILGSLISRVHDRYKYEKRKRMFISSSDFWKNNYKAGGHSGYGSYNELAIFKAEVINEFIDSNEYESYAEFGCGDGNQIDLIHYPSFSGYDISEECIEICKQRFKSKENMSFSTMKEYVGQQYDVTLSLDVLFHLVEDEVYKEYLDTLFKASRYQVIIYSSNTNDNSSNYYPQVRHRKFTEDIKLWYPDFKLKDTISNKFPFKGSSKSGSFSDFYFFEKS